MVVVELDDVVVEVEVVLVVVVGVVAVDVVGAGAGASVCVTVVVLPPPHAAIPVTAPTLRASAVAIVASRFIVLLSSFSEARESSESRRCAREWRLSGA